MDETHDMVCFFDFCEAELDLSGSESTKREVSPGDRCFIYDACVRLKTSALSSVEFKI
jgi:hypothetical protein